MSAAVSPVPNLHPTRTAPRWSAAYTTGCLGRRNSTVIYEDAPSDWMGHWGEQ